MICHSCQDQVGLGTFFLEQLGVIEPPPYSGAPEAHCAVRQSARLSHSAYRGSINSLGFVTRTTAKIALSSLKLKVRCACYANRGGHRKKKKNVYFHYTFVCFLCPSLLT